MTITEGRARELFAEELARESDREPNYLAKRLEGGWFFGWKPEAGEPPIGGDRWVVTDDQQVDALGPDDEAQHVLDKLNSIR